MIPLIDCSPQQLCNLATECGFPDKFGQLLTPLTNYRISEHVMFGIDNGGYSRACPERYERLLLKALPFRNRCLWAAAPDVPESAKRTLELFYQWQGHIKELGYRLALVAQDGLQDEHIPWSKFEAIFIGGSTEWKMGSYAKQIIRTAQWMKKTVHVGRINTAGRWLEFQKQGVDTFDGSGIARPYPGARENRKKIAQARFGTSQDSVYQKSPVLTVGVSGLE